MRFKGNPPGLLPIVEKVEPESEAESLGVQSGWQMQAVGDTSLFGMTVDDWQELLKRNTKCLVNEALPEPAKYCWSHPQVGPHICVRHWKPLPGFDQCTRIFHGERVNVTWSDDWGMWAFGHALDGRFQGSFFPQTVLKKLTHIPRPRQVGCVVRATDSFTPPEDVGGYLTVLPGDSLEVLHPIDPPYVWAYVECTSVRGWVPECILGAELLMSP
mmetsp:Transcript_15406/g.28499  ORF Transcript_15406/g.28499 Transcript_15406/m.28499 type:complete len:215 (-) Transcript_15406:144-788(-)